jgi:hypothetical protein
MLRNYIAVAFRNLVTSRLHSVINIGGLAVGLAACVLIILYVRDELSYERWLPNADRIAAVETTLHIPGREIARASSAGPIKAALEKDFGSDIERAVRIYGHRGPVQVGDRPFMLSITHVDPGFFDEDRGRDRGDRRARVVIGSAIALRRWHASHRAARCPRLARSRHHVNVIGGWVTTDDALLYSQCGQCGCVESRRSAAARMHECTNARMPPRAMAIGLTGPARTPRARGCGPQTQDPFWECAFRRGPLCLVATASTAFREGAPRQVLVLMVRVRRGAAIVVNQRQGMPRALSLRQSRGGRRQRERGLGERGSFDEEAVHERQLFGDERKRATQKRFEMIGSHQIIEM